MEGVTILNQMDILESPNWVVLTIFSLAIVFGISFAVGINSEPDKWYSPLAAIMVILCLLGIIILMFISGELREPTGKYEYEAIIDDTVVFTELYEKYEVVEQRGEIWVLKDKDEE